MRNGTADFVIRPLKENYGRVGDLTPVSRWLLIDDCVKKFLGQCSLGKNALGKSSCINLYRAMDNESQNSSFEHEIKDAQLIFDSVWEELEEEIHHRDMRFPKELILLGGAPGSGKGTHTAFIMQARNLHSPPIVISQLLDSPEAKQIKDKGQLVGDREVLSILLRKLLEPEFREGALLDGFPRSRVQAECMQLLVEKINQLHEEFQGTVEASHFTRPTIHAVVLFIGEEVSISRQMSRGRQIKEHNELVAKTGEGEMLELRPTDIEPHLAAKRYRTFKEKTWDALQSLKEIYHYHSIMAEGSIEEVEVNILEELSYQSSLELEPATYERLRALPLAQHLSLNARAELVNRLDDYELNHTDLFKRVIEIVGGKFMTIIRRHAVSGRAVVTSDDPIFENPLALSILIDIFSERGFHAMVDKRHYYIPESFDLQTGRISNRTSSVIRVTIFFKGSEIRRG